MSRYAQKPNRSKLSQQLRDSRLKEIHFIFGFTAATPHSIFHVELMRTRDCTLWFNTEAQQRISYNLCQEQRYNV